jgi:hypothetical protein
MLGPVQKHVTKLLSRIYEVLGWGLLAEYRGACLDAAPSHPPHLSPTVRQQRLFGLCLGFGVGGPSLWLGAVVRGGGVGVPAERRTTAGVFP